MKYILKDGKQVESIPVGKSSVKIGEVNDIGYLTVVSRGPNNNVGRGAMVICKCKCGNYTMIKLNAFRNGTTKSCGCYNIELHRELCKEVGKRSYFKDYTNKENPFYTFIKSTDQRDKDGSVYWEIECKQCKKHYFEIPAYLVSDIRRKGNNPCDCWRQISKGVLKIKNILNENNIFFETEKTFSNCLSLKNNLMKFDFYIKDRYLIEYDGEQHFIPESFGDSKSGDEKLKLQKEYDNIKNKWCKENNIPLIRIPYTHYNDINIDDLKLETSKFII